MPDRDPYRDYDDPRLHRRPTPARSMEPDLAIEIRVRPLGGVLVPPAARRLDQISEEG